DYEIYDWDPTRRKKSMDAPQALEVFVNDERPRDLNLSGTLEFMRLLWAVDHALQSTSKRMEQKFGVTGPQRLVIRIVGQFPRASAGEIARILQIHPSTDR